MTVNFKLPNNDSNEEGEVLVCVEGVSKKFCRSLRKSLWYGVQDIAQELNPFHRRASNDEKKIKSEERLTNNTAQPTTNEEPSTKNTGLRPDEFWAVNDVSFKLRRGECLGLIGHNGAGKTTLLKMLNGLIKPDSGKIEMRGRVGALIALGAGFNPILTGRENIYVNGSVLGLSDAEIDKKVDDIIDFAEIREFIEAPVQSYSSGMQVRLGFAVATAMEPDVLILDEVLAVGDATFRAKCFQRIGKVLDKSAVVFVSHSEAQVQRICSRAICLRKGIVQATGNVQKVLQIYREDQMENGESYSEWVIGEGVESVIVQERCQQIKWGDSLIFTVKISCSRRVVISNLYCQWHLAGASVAQSEFPNEQIQTLTLNSGLNTIEICTGPALLAHGDYDISLAAFTSNGKLSVAHTYCALKVKIQGSLGIGPAVILPSHVVLQPTIQQRLHSSLTFNAKEKHS